MSESDNQAFLTRRDDLFLPAPIARGPWNPNSLHGRLLAGLLAHTVEQRFGRPDFQFARLTIDLFRLPPLAPLSIDVALRREGNRIRVAEGSISSEGLEVARGSVVMLRRAEQPEGEV
ncbi:MAG TPA: acyl-CoA thioesterase domain-containing protein, partial [Dehalococcoidia bacterium]|nr:acyl-CoA thioesterase domain-containing protein [Dehalococcoidia bacterium]